MRVPLVAALLFMLPGCVDTESGHPLVLANPLCPHMEGAAFTEAFDGTAPVGWQAVSGSWSVVANATALSGGHAMRGTGVGATSNLVACPHSDFSDFELDVDLRIVAPAEDAAGAGVVVHFHNATNHQILRYSVRESGWHIFIWNDTVTRSKQSEANVEGPSPQHAAGEWIHMKVVAKGALLTVYDGSTKVLEYQLPPGHSRSGAVGLFLRDVTTADFDNLVVKPL